MIRRPPRSTQSRSSAASDVYKRQSYDLRDHGKVTPVRSQDNFSTCWIHSAMASLDSCLLPGALFDFSENNLANHMGSRLDFEGRSDARLSTAYFARWDGPVLERADPYPRKGRSPEGLRPVRHVQEVLYLPDRRTPLDNDVLKWAVSTYGGVDTAMAFEASYDNSHTFAYYSTTCLLYTSDAADDLLCVDLGGRRILT